MYRRLKTLFPIIVGVLLIVSFFTLRGEAQQPNNSGKTDSASVKRPMPALKPVAGHPERFAVSKAARDLPNALEVDDSAIAELPMYEMNVLNRRILKTPNEAAKTAPSLDSALRGLAEGRNQLMVPGAPIANFDGLTAVDSGTTAGATVAPSDQNVDVGPNDVVQTVNTGIFRIYDKTGVPKIAAKKISDLFTNLGGICAQNNQGDPVILYDRLANRWMITQFAFTGQTTPPYHQCVAVSTTADPAGTYYAYDFITPGNEFPDYGKFGVWPDGYYFTVNQFTMGGGFNGLGAYALDRKKMLVGDPNAGFIYFSLNGVTNPEFVASVQPSDHDGLEAPPLGAPNVFAYMLSDEYEIPPFNVDAMRMFNFHADFSNPGNSTFTERPESPVAVPAYDPRMPEFQTGTRQEIEQPPPAANADRLNAIGYHLMFRLQYMKRGIVESLVSCMTVNISGVAPNSGALYHAAVRYFEMHKTSANGTYTVFDSATFAPDAPNGATGTNRFLPAAAIDNKGNLAVSYSVSSTTIFPSIWYAGRDFNAAGFPAAGLSGEQVLFNGTASQLATQNRWGDYQSVGLDPSDDCTFWTTNQYYNVNSQFNWRTRIGSFKFASCTAPAQGTLSGTITACDSGAPIAGAIVEVSNGFSTTTAANGTYSVQLAPGFYTVRVSNAPNNCTTSGTAPVSITNGATTTYNTCLSGSANVVRDVNDPSTITVSGGNGNGIINPNECNNLTVELLNNGCAPARNVTAVLTTSTPNVTITRPNATYPDIPINGSASNTPAFQVSTSNSFVCGTPINFSLTVSYAGGNNVINFTLQTCTELQADITVNGSIDAADPKNVGRLGRNGISSVCGVAKACPGRVSAVPTSYDQHVFVNGPAPACATITINSVNGAGIIGSAYLGAFNPADTTHCTGYIGDPGGSNTVVSWKVNVPGGQTLAVAVEEVTAGANPGAYSVTVSGLTDVPIPGNGACAAPTLTTQVNDSAITLGESTFDTATLSGTFSDGTLTFRLYGPNDGTCAGAVIFSSSQPVAGDGFYSSTPFTPTAEGSYNWVASYSDGNNPVVTTACNDANEIVTVTAAPTPTPTPTPTATPVPTATPSPTASPTATPASQTVNLSTRMRVAAGDDNSGIGGFIITGSAPKHVIIRAIGPSLTKFGFAPSEVLADPTLEVHGPGSFGVITNNDWRDSQEAQIKADGLPPTNDLESAIDATLPPGAYTAIVRANAGTPAAGIALFEVYDLDTASASNLANLSTRAFVGTGNAVVIAGFVLGNNAGDDRVVVRGLGPSLADFGIANPLADPTLELRDENGSLLVSNNDWQDDAAQAAELTTAGLAPSEDEESAIAATLPPGLYTAILSGLNNTTGVGLVEVYDRGP
jgi:hypothetical protein